MPEVKRPMLADVARIWGKRCPLFERWVAHRERRRRGCRGEPAHQAVPRGDRMPSNADPQARAPTAHGQRRPRAPASAASWRRVVHPWGSAGYHAAQRGPERATDPGRLVYPDAARADIERPASAVHGCANEEPTAERTTDLGHRTRSSTQIRSAGRNAGSARQRPLQQCLSSPFGAGGVREGKELTSTANVWWDLPSLDEPSGKHASLERQAATHRETKPSSRGFT